MEAVKTVELVDLGVVTKVIEVLKENMPEDCADILDSYYKRLTRDIISMGLDKAMEKWSSKNDVIIEDNV